MEYYNVIVSVETTVCIEAENNDDAIKKIEQALNNGDAEITATVGEDISSAMRHKRYKVTDAILMDE